MSRPSLRTPSLQKESSKGIEELDRAATALREKLLAEFQARRDSSAHHFYKEMAIHPARCRVMWLHEHRLSYRKKPEFDEHDLYAIRVLRKDCGLHLKLFCDDFAEVIKWFIESLRRIRYDIDWIEREAERIWSLLADEYPIWTQIACDGKPVGQNWCAPGWLDKWPAQLSPKALLSVARGGRLDAERTADVLKALTERSKEIVGRAQRDALNGLRIRFAQEREAARQVARAANAQAPQPSAQSTTKADAPKELKELGKKEMELSQYFDAANLTERQYQCASLKWEYGRPTREIARRLDLHHKTVQECLNAVGRRLERDQNFKRKLKERMARHSSDNQLV